MGARVYIRKKSTGAIWSSVMPHLGNWKKESLGIKFDETRGVGSVAHNFWPFSRRWKNQFEVIKND